MRRLARTVVVVGLLIVACGHAAAPTSGGWDPLAADHARVVEELRGERFASPVDIRFVDLDSGSSSSDPSRPPTAIRTDDYHRALGLATSEFDVKLEQETARSGYGAFFDGVRRVIVLGVERGERPDEIGPELAPILAHELTHALQAQRAPGTDPGIEATPLYRFALEGEAEWVLQRYVRTLDAEDRQRWQTWSQERWERRPEVEAIVEADLLVPYEVGGSFFAGRFAADGLDGVAAAWTLLDPVWALDPLGSPAPAPSSPAPVDSWSADPPDDAVMVPFRTDGEFSPIRVYQILATMLPAPEALAAARSVRTHDRPVVWVEDVGLCLAAPVGAASAGLGLLTDAFERWAAELSSWRSIERIDAGLVVRACDPGAGMVPAPLVDPVQAVLQLGVLLEGEAWAVSSGLPATVGNCVAWDILGSSDVPLERFTVAAVDALDTEAIPVGCR